MNDLPNLRLLVIFKSIVEHAGFLGAQEELNLSASAISNHLSALEEQVGFTLCQRGRAGFRLTEKGEKFYQHALTILECVAEFNEATAELNTTLIGDLNIGILDGLVDNQALNLPEIIYQFHKAFPSVNIKLQTNSPNALQRGIINNEYTVAIGSFLHLYNGVWMRPLFQESQLLYCGQKHPLYDRQKITKSEIAQYNIVGKTYWSDQMLAKRGFRQSRAIANNMETQLLMILSGAFIGYLPEHYAASRVASGELRALDFTDFNYDAQFSLICKKSRLREPIIHAFRQLMRQASPHESATLNPS